MTGLWPLGLDLDLDVAFAWSYAIAVLLPAFDALIPVLPAETALIVLGVATAGSADPRIALLIALAAAGAFLGDNVAYLLGRRFGPAIARRVFTSPKGAHRHAWARRALDRYGVGIIIGCRFIPAGRTAVTVTCGLIGYNQRRFIAATAAAGVIWASYAFLIGRLGGKVFANNPWAGLLLGLGIALVISAAAEAARRIFARARARRPSTRASESHPVRSVLREPTK
ncbi:MAG TPA: VTT domain-containing protein [Streptosporangiaceae bacterium]|nr:VTT domain-containing protein [Streptosporangiaceae bacterium]